MKQPALSIALSSAFDLDHFSPKKGQKQGTGRARFIASQIQDPDAGKRISLIGHALKSEGKSFAFD